MPHLKRGAMRDFLSIMHSHNYYEEANWNRSDSIYNFETGSYIEFFSADDPAKMRGARRDVLFINECNNVAFTAFEQLEVRTRHLVILDYNPVSEFWVQEEVMPHMDHDFLLLTYKDNEALGPEIITSIESRQHNSNWWRVYGLGEIGLNEGAIYQNWEFVDIVPEDARLERHTLDFGFTIDPSASIDIYYYDGWYYLDEILYQTGLTNNQLGQFFKPLPRATIVADSAEPKSIVEMRRYDLPVVPAVKGPGSVNYGIQLVQDQKIRVTKRSTNLIKEYRNYLWKVDKDGKTLNVPIDIWNHGMDAVRYGFSELKMHAKPRTFVNKPAGF